MDSVESMYAADYAVESVYGMDNELHAIKKLGCGIVYSPSASNLCDGYFCSYDWNCASGCCWGNYCRSSCAGYDLMWLWWTLTFLFIFCCLISIMAAARRRRRMMAM